MTTVFYLLLIAEPKAEDMLKKIDRNSSQTKMNSIDTEMDCR